MAQLSSAAASCKVSTPFINRASPWPPAAAAAYRWRRPPAICLVRAQREEGNAHEGGEQLREGGLSAAPPIPRRSAALLLAAAAVAQLVNRENAKAETSLAEPPLLTLVPYDDAEEGFKLLRPAGWNKVEKAGATLLFQDPEKKSSTIGVVVNKVRIPSLREFGSLEDVANKLIAAERKKESTREATLLNASSREARGGVPLYVMEYFLDSTRGAKRTLTAVTIASKKLYILNIAFADSRDSPAPASLADPLHRVLESFDLID